MAKIITYETLREIQREERKTEKLSRLEDNFYDSIKEYLTRRVKDELSLTEIRNAKNVLQDIFDRRERKILNQALSTIRGDEKIDSTLMTTKENEFFNALISVLKEFRSFVAFNNIQQIAKIELIEPEVQAEKTNSDGNYLSIKILDDMPEIVGADLKNYGPFKKGETAVLPKDNANILIEKNKASLL